jgi:hypothetical protein
MPAVRSGGAVQLPQRGAHRRVVALRAREPLWALLRLLLAAVLNQDAAATAATPVNAALLQHVARRGGGVRSAGHLYLHQRLASDATRTERVPIVQADYLAVWVADHQLQSSGDGVARAVDDIRHSLQQLQRAVHKHAAPRGAEQSAELDRVLVGGERRGGGGTDRKRAQQRPGEAARHWRRSCPEAAECINYKPRNQSRELLQMHAMRAPHLQRRPPAWYRQLPIKRQLQRRAGRETAARQRGAMTRCPWWRRRAPPRAAPRAPWRPARPCPGRVRWRPC